MCAAQQCSLQPSRPLACLGLLLQTAGKEQGTPFMSMRMSTEASATKNLPPDPLASRGQKNECQKNTLHNTLCNKLQKLIAGAEKQKNRKIMLRPTVLCCYPGMRGTREGSADSQTETLHLVTRHFEHCTKIHNFQNHI